jgi:6-phospho-beta-glucosidase
MKIAVIGGGSTYTPELINGFLTRTANLPVSEVWLMDIDAERLAIVGGFAQRMVASKGAPFKLILTQDQRAAIEGASYVLTQLRRGGRTSTWDGGTAWWGRRRRGWEEWRKGCARSR